MIGYLKGTIIEKKKSSIILDVSGVGYRVSIGENTHTKFSTGDTTELFIYTAVRETAIDLYGFLHSHDVDLFETLISVSGVGPKIAGTILGIKSADQIHQAVANADVAFFQSISGIGKKGAQKIIVELKGKMPGKDIDLSDDGGDEVVDALTQFGFSRAEVLATISDIDSSLSTEDQIREGLKLMGKRK